MGYLQATEDPSPDRATLRELLGKRVSPSQCMRTLVDDLLLLTRLEPGSAFGNLVANASSTCSSVTTRASQYAASSVVAAVSNVFPPQFSLPVSR